MYCIFFEMAQRHLGDVDGMFANQLYKSLRDLKSGMVQTEKNNLFHRQNSFVYNNLLTTLGNVRGNSAVFGN